MVRKIISIKICALLRTCDSVISMFVKKISQYLQERNCLHHGTISFLITIIDVCRKIIFCATLQF